MNVKPFVMAAGIVSSLILSGTAQAALTGIAIDEITGITGGPANLKVFRVYAEFDGLGGAADGVVAVFGDTTNPLTTSTGSGGGLFLNSALGTDLPPNPLFIPVFPDLEWDSWVTVGDDTSAATATTTPGFAAAGLTGDFSLTNDAWSVIPTDANGLPVAGRVLLAQFAIIQGNDLLPDLTLSWNIQDRGGNQFRGIQAEAGPRGVPAPGALALLGLAGIAGTRRRRR